MAYVPARTYVKLPNETDRTRSAPPISCPRVRLFGPPSRLVLLVADLFHPFDRLPIEPFQDGDVRHGRGCGGAVPVLLAGRAPDHVTRANLLDRASPALHESAAGGHDQGLTERMGVPCRPGAGLERYTDA